MPPVATGLVNTVDNPKYQYVILLQPKFYYEIQF